ncbi:hypothetical protein KUTeg_020338 [Tegillarca granosa]|uniref:Uncharacterized protein n=1 Tax=Tegillarca granosa TaxID=220873 RepID=A0ABQ9EAB9_TEGGR|nr:hypothetical protein KUTeg_020338 [Tegillarca granosa]
MQSDVDMEDVSMLYQYGDGISPDEGSDDYSMMSVGSSENSGSLQRKHRPKYLNISRSVSATSSEDENTDSNVSTDNEGRLAPLAIMNEAVVAQAASAFAEEMEDFKTETSEDSWKDMFDKSDSEFPDELKMHKSPNGPVSPSWREGLDSPPFSPPRRDSYPGKRRASSPVSPKDKLHFTYTDMSPPSRQLSLDELYGDGHAHAAHEGGAHGGVNFVQKPSPVSPEEINNSLITTTGEHLFFEKPKEKRLQENLTLKPDIVSHEISEESRVMDLATFAASVASSTANLTQMTVSPTNLTVNTTT